jgi:hypothetical protein
MDFKYNEAVALLDLFGGDENMVVTVQDEKGCTDPHSGPGIYAWDAEYPEDGSTFLGFDPGDKDDDDYHDPDFPCGY